jgi:hypothetical protein
MLPETYIASCLAVLAIEQLVSLLRHADQTISVDDFEVVLVTNTVLNTRPGKRVTA